MSIYYDSMDKRWDQIHLLKDVFNHLLWMSFLQKIQLFLNEQSSHPSHDQLMVQNVTNYFVRHGKVMSYIKLKSRFSSTTCLNLWTFSSSEDVDLGRKWVRAPIHLHYKYWNWYLQFPNSCRMVSPRVKENASLLSKFLKHIHIFYINTYILYLWTITVLKK